MIFCLLHSALFFIVAVAAVDTAVIQDTVSEVQPANISVDTPHRDTQNEKELKTETNQNDSGEALCALQAESTDVVDEEHLNDSKIASVTIVAGIKEDMLKYKHWTGSYSPDVFNLFINDVPVPVDGSYVLESPEKPFVVSFDYSFMKGMRKGTKRYTCTLEDACAQANITFSWLEKNKIILDNGVVIE
jgi:hypothetical protein